DPPAFRLGLTDLLAEFAGPRLGRAGLGGEWLAERGNARLGAGAFVAALAEGAELGLGRARLLQLPLYGGPLDKSALGLGERGLVRAEFELDPGELLLRVQLLLLELVLFLVELRVEAALEVGAVVPL